MLLMPGENLRVNLKQHAGKVCVSELEMPLVVEFVESWAERVVVFQVKIVHFGFRSGVPAVFANIHLQKKR